MVLSKCSKSERKESTVRDGKQKGRLIQVTDHNITPLVHLSPRHEYNGFSSQKITKVFHP